MKGQSNNGHRSNENGELITTKKPARIIGPKRKSKRCQGMNCNSFSDSDRLKIFKYFWKLSWAEKIIYNV
jgi:hypothetical protein